LEAPGGVHHINLPSLPKRRRFGFLQRRFVTAAILFVKHNKPTVIGLVINEG
jgi:hypothetical protein